jgi:hypothetical protein
MVEQISPVDRGFRFVEDDLTFFLSFFSMDLVPRSDFGFREVERERERDLVLSADLDRMEASFDRLMLPIS